MEFRHDLVLIYFNTVKESYTYNDIVNLLGITYVQAEDIISELINKELLFLMNIKLPQQSLHMRTFVWYND